YRAREAGDCPRSHQHRSYRCPRPQLRYGRAAEEDDRRDRDGIQAEGEPAAGDGLYRGLSAAGYRTDASKICQMTGVSCGVLPGALRSGSALVGAPKRGTPQIRGNDVHTFAGCPTDTDTNASPFGCGRNQIGKPRKGSTSSRDFSTCLKTRKKLPPRIFVISFSRNCRFKRCSVILMRSSSFSKLGINLF